MSKHYKKCNDCKAVKEEVEFAFGSFTCKDCQDKLDKKKTKKDTNDR